MSSEYGPFDRFVELGVLLLIAYEVFVPMIQRSRQRRKYEGEMQSMIDSLSQGEASALRDLALYLTLPQADISEALKRKMPSVISRNYVGLCIVERHQPFFEKWAKKRT